MRRLVALFLFPSAVVLAAAGLQGLGQRGADATPSPPAVAVVSPAAPVAWLPPDWLDGVDTVALDRMALAGPRDGPRVRSRAAFVYDLDADQVLFEQRADVVRPVASLTKVVSALAMASVDGDLEAEVCIGAEQYPTRSGARSRLSTGDCTTGGDLLGAALVASDNRAAYGLAATAGMDVDAFIGQMNQVAQDLGMAHSSFTDPSGLEDENLSTARDMARATVALAAMPQLATAASAASWELERPGRRPRRLFSTNKLLDQVGLNVLAAKTGYTDTARYCLTTLVETAAGQRVVMTFLGADGKLTRWADARRVLAWLEAG